MSKIRKRFCRDYKIPITIYSDPYFKYFLELLDPYYNTLEKYELLTNSYRNFCHGRENGSEYIEHLYQITMAVIDDIKCLSDYHAFNEYKYPTYEKRDIRKNNVFVPENVGKWFLTIDMEMANFQSMNFVVPNMLGESYDKLMRKFTNDPYVLGSKYIRQVIFGNLNPKRQQIFQKYIMSTIADEMFLDKQLSIVDFTADSITFSFDEFPDGIANDVTDRCRAVFDGKISLRPELFLLNRIEKTKFYVQDFTNGNIKFKGVPAYLLAQVVKKYENTPLHSNDLLFWFEGRIAKFLEPLFESK